MNFKPNPLLYGANETFFSTFRLAVRLKETVDFPLLSQAVWQVMVRYPYFCVCPCKEGEELVLHQNANPLPVFPDDRTVTLGSEESGGHLISFGCKNNTIFIDVSHYLADGMGVSPLMKSLLYGYLSLKHGGKAWDTKGIRLPESPLCQGECEYPFPDSPMETEDSVMLPKLPKEVYGLDANAFEGEGLYAYHLHIPQREMMAKASSSDGSPVSFLSVLMYRSLHKLNPNIEKPVVAHVQHQYRPVLNVPLSHHSLVNYLPVVLPPRLKEREVEQQNTVVRGQVILKGSSDGDRVGVNRLIGAFPKQGTFEEKKDAMAGYAQNSTRGKTFGISYVGKMDWGCLAPYVADLHVYIGEKHTKNMLLIEVMTVGDDFSLTFMQRGKGERYVNAFMEEIGALEIPVTLVGEEPYSLCNTTLLGKE